MKTKVMDQKTKQWYWTDEPNDLYEGEAYIRPILGIRTIRKIDWPEVEGSSEDRRGTSSIYQTFWVK